VKRVFAHFNAVVPEESFLVSTPTIEYVQQTLRPLQGVVANQGFMVPGTLANYAIPEWFAHGFRSAQEKQVLSSYLASHPFVTPTAALIRCPGVKFESPGMTYLAIRYVLCTEPQMQDGLISSRKLETSGRVSQPSKPIQPDTPLQQFFRLMETIQADQISILVATHGRKTAHSDLSMRLYKEGQLLAKASVAADQIGDNQWISFGLGKTLTLDAADYLLLLETHPGPAKGNLSVWLYRHQSPLFHIQHGSERIRGVLATRMYLENPPQINELYRLHRIEPGVYLYENKQVLGSGYYLATLEAGAQPDFHSVSLRDYQAKQLELEYTGEQAGWIVLPMRAYPGWQAYVNDKPVVAERFLDILPAIAVQPRDVVSYRYEPLKLYLSAMLSLLGLLSLLVLTVRLRSQ
jgi:hypothetical protein